MQDDEIKGGAYPEIANKKRLIRTLTALFRITNSSGSTRPTLSHAEVTLFSNGVRFVATDGFILARFDFLNTGEERLDVPIGKAAISSADLKNLRNCVRGVKREKGGPPLLFSFLYDPHFFSIGHNQTAGDEPLMSLDRNTETAKRYPDWSVIMNARKYPQPFKFRGTAKASEIYAIAKTGHKLRKHQQYITISAGTNPDTEVDEMDFYLRGVTAADGGTLGEVKLGASAHIGKEVRMHLASKNMLWAFDCLKAHAECAMTFIPGDVGSNHPTAPQFLSPDELELFLLMPARMER